jgi:shikimate dehydrogenase
VNIDTSTELCAVIGNPVAHSLSPLMHNAAFDAAGINGVYLAFEVRDLPAFFTGMRAMPSFRGLSVTIPHKIAAMAYLDEIDALAQQTGCVNTVINEKGRLRGMITDGLGTLRAFSEAGVALDGKKILFLGSGGAVRAVAFAMALRTGAAGITILGRTPRRVDAIIRDVSAAASAPVTGGSLAKDLTAAMAAHDIVIHGTPIGMHGGNTEASCLPPGMLRAEQVVFDMVYRPLKTRLLRDAEAAGATVIPGLEMLVHQAVLQFEAWTGQNAPYAVMRRELVRALEEDG